MSTQPKAYKGMAMEGLIADWYAKNTRRDTRRFRDTARAVAERARLGARVLEVAPGPGYLAIELAKRGYEVVGLDISRSFVRIASRNAADAGVAARFEHGDAAHMPFPDASFDFVVCTAAFKNFTDPAGVLDEIHRVLKPGGGASIVDLRKDAPLAAIHEEVRGMNLSRLNAALTMWTFRFFLLKNAYTREAIDALARRSRFGGCELVEQGIRLRSPPREGSTPTSSMAARTTARGVLVMTRPSLPHRALSRGLRVETAGLDSLQVATRQSVPVPACQLQEVDASSRSCGTPVLAAMRLP